jgi:hypothetical protein
VEPSPVLVNPEWGHPEWVNLGRASLEVIHAPEAEWVISLAEMYKVELIPARVNPEWGHRGWENLGRASPERDSHQQAPDLPRVQWADNLIV